MNILFQIDGGLGKSIMSTAIVKAIKKQYKSSNLIVVTGFPDVFLNNPHISEVYNMQQASGLYNKFIKDKESKVFITDPYRTSDFILDKPKSLLKVWCELYGIKYNNEKPEIYLTDPELEYFRPYYQLEKPILAIQTNGGPPGLNYQYAWTRDIPECNVHEIIDYYKDDYTIIHIKRQDQKIYPDTMQALDGFRSIAVLLQLSSKRLLMDSFAQHLAVSLGLNSTVCWISTKPEIFGYKQNDNVLANPFTKEPCTLHAVYQPFNLSQDISTIPYNSINEVFDTNKIIESINNQK